MSALAIVASIIRTHRIYITPEKGQSHPAIPRGGIMAPSRSGPAGGCPYPSRGGAGRAGQQQQAEAVAGLSLSRVGRRMPLLPPSLYEHPAAELSVDDSA
jgi:hypothetical protein